MRIKIFEDSDSAQDILNSIVANGVAGVSGGRVLVRQKLKEVSSLAKTSGLKSILTDVTIDHPDTELGYPFDMDKFDLEDAKDKVQKAYDAGAASTP